MHLKVYTYIYYFFEKEKKRPGAISTPKHETTTRSRHHSLDTYVVEQEHKAPFAPTTRYTPHRLMHDGAPGRKGSGGFAGFTDGTACKGSKGLKLRAPLMSRAQTARKLAKARGMSAGGGGSGLGLGFSDLQRPIETTTRRRRRRWSETIRALPFCRRLCLETKRHRLHRSPKNREAQATSRSIFEEGAIA